MAINKMHNQYVENSIYTSAPEDLTLMLYNGLVKFIMIAQSAMLENNFEKTNTNIQKAQKIIHEFRATLDMKYEVSENLDVLYEYMNRRLIDANVKKDESILLEVLNYAKEMRDTWGQAMKIAKMKPATPTEIAK